MTVKGTVEEIIFRNESNGYTVFCLERCDSADDEYITVVGNFPSIHEGAMLEIEGTLKSNTRYGEQFSASAVRFLEPSGTAAITRYLSSGLIKGVGAVLAVRICERFGRDSLSVIELNPIRLAEVKGISPRKAAEISASYKDNKVVQEAVMFLGRYDISLNLALRIYSVYKEATEKIVTNNPYRLVEDVDGIGFLTADRIAARLGIPKDSEFRLRAGVLHALIEAAEGGNTYLPADILCTECVKLLGAPRERLVDTIAALKGDGRVKEVIVEGQEGITSPAYYHFEKIVSDKLSMLAATSSEAEGMEDELAHYESVNAITLHPEQKRAITMACHNGVTIITGGPGTGKTTIIKCVISCLKARQETVLLTAPTGRAAKRLSEASGEEAKTIHRALACEGISGAFYYNESTPLPFSTVIVDEVSMVDAYLMASLLKALQEGARLVLVGDSDQLPSVGAGNILGDIIESGRFQTVRLTEVYRQGSGSMIVDNAYKINNGEMPIFSGSDFFFSAAQEHSKVVDEIVSMCLTRIPSYLSVQPSQIQVLAPLKNGLTGIDNLNKELQAALNPPTKSKKEITVGKRLFREGDRVMHTANRYALEWLEVTDKGSITGKGVFNGDIGAVRSINPENGVIEVLFDDNRLAAYTREDAPDLTLSYAITIHKSQGSEFEVVIIPATGGNPSLLTRNLLYTAVTRAKRMVVLVGDKYHIRRMVDNNRTDKRYTMLKALLPLSAERLKTLEKYSKP